jgi:plasmid stabilization system protein ParE
MSREHAFPYGVFYAVEAARVVVISVFHGRKNPTRWHKRV